MSYLGLQGRIENEHSDRLTEAVKEIFPYPEVLHVTGTGRYETLILSRLHRYRHRSNLRGSQGGPAG